MPLTVSAAWTCTISTTSPAAMEMDAIWANPSRIDHGGIAHTDREMASARSVVLSELEPVGR